MRHSTAAVFAVVGVATVAAIEHVDASARSANAGAATSEATNAGNLKRERGAGGRGHLRTEPADLLCRDDDACRVDGVGLGRWGPTLTASGLGRPAFVLPPLGEVRPSGWLKQQLLLQANALSGFMPTSTFPGAVNVNQSVWVGGEFKTGTDQWLPYWTNGNVPLVELLRAAGAAGELDPAANLAATVDGYVEYILAHTNKSNGWIGPFVNEPGDSNGHGLWDPLNMLRTLLNYAQAHPDREREITAACVAHMTREAELLRTDPVIKWAQTRWPTYAEIALYILDVLVPKYGGDPPVMPLGSRGTEEMLLGSAALFEQKGMNWHNYYHRVGSVKFPLGPVQGWNTNDHGVNNAEGALRYPAVAFRMHNNDSFKAEMTYFLSMLDTYQGQVQSLFCADEVFCGREPHRGTETCAVVEAMASLEYAFVTLGDPALMDRVERLAFNAMPAALTADMWTHVYVQQANSVFAGNTHPDVAADGARAHADHGCACRTGVHASPDTPSGEDMGANFYGVSHFPCCITNGWPKFAMHAIVAEADGSGFVVASLVPATAVLSSVGANVTTESEYPFGSTATVTVLASKTVTAKVRVPGWAVGATVNGARAANGTLVPVSCKAGATTTIEIDLHTAPRVERGWGGKGVASFPAVSYSASGASIPTASEADFSFAGGATFESVTRAPGTVGIRTGGLRQNTSATLAHVLAGDGHAVASVSFSFRYAAGYTPPKGKTAAGATLALVAYDYIGGKHLATLYQSPPLTNYSYDRFNGYSPPVNVSVTGLRLPNGRPVALVLEFCNHDRNLELAFPAGRGLGVAVAWSPERGPGPVVPVPPFVTGPENAAAVLWGPLVFALHPKERVKVVKTYEQDLPNRPKAVDYEIGTNDTWAYALDLSQPVTVDPTPSPGWSASTPFSTDGYAVSVTVTARHLPSWGYWQGSMITDSPPPSPVDCGGGEGGGGGDSSNVECGPPERIRLVPLGGTNIRISVFPWVES